MPLILKNKWQNPFSNTTIIIRKSLQPYVEFGIEVAENSSWEKGAK
jgi:hypothetical protein